MSDKFITCQTCEDVEICSAFHGDCELLAECVEENEKLKDHIEKMKNQFNCKQSYRSNTRINGKLIRSELCLCMDDKCPCEKWELKDE